MAFELTTEIPGGWKRVVYASECGDPEDELLECWVCGDLYADCPCPGPTMDDEYEYEEFSLPEGNFMFARKKDGADAETE